MFAVLCYTPFTVLCYTPINWARVGQEFNRENIASVCYDQWVCNTAQQLGQEFNRENTTRAMKLQSHHNNVIMTSLKIQLKFNV